VPIGDVIPATGAVSSTDSRVNSRFDQVIAIRSDLASDTPQVTAALNGITGRGASFQLSYTYTRAQDQSSFSGGGASQGFAAATTAGDPNLREWSPSSFERRHSFLATITFPITGSLEMTSIGRLSSGGPFRPHQAEPHARAGARAASDRSCPRTTHTRAVGQASGDRTRAGHSTAARELAHHCAVSAAE
jgi:hypothetical protein